MQPFFYYIVAIVTIFFLALLNIVPSFFMFIVLVMAFIPIARGALGQLKEKKVGSEVFLVIATLVGLYARQEKAIATVLIIMLIAEYLQDIVKERTEKEIKGLVALMPGRVIVRDGDQEKEVPRDALAIGDIVLIKTGKRIPVDGLVKSGFACVNESALTGESMPVEKKQGDIVYAGSYIESGSLLVIAQKIAEDTLFAHIAALVADASTSKAKIATFADKVAIILVPTMLIFIGIVFFITRDLSLVVTLLVFGSPLELSLVTPMAMLAGIAAAFRQGILVKGGLALERLASVDVMIFDKTGTLTLGEPEVVAIKVFNSLYTQNDILRLSAIAEKHADHVIAQAVLKKARQFNLDIPDPDTYASYVGNGVMITFQGKKYFLGNKHFIENIEHANIKIDEQKSDNELYSSFYLVCEQDGVCGQILIADELRSEAKDTMQALKKDGIQEIMLLSGDKKEIVDHVASLLGIEKAYGHLFPDQKINIIRELQKNKRHVAMVGDGINDAPALKKADVGIALGAMGMEPAIDAADIVLMTNDLQKIVFVHQLAKKTRKVIMQNIIFGFGLVHAVGITLAFMKIINPIQAALIHAVPDLAMILNSARLMWFKGNNR